MPNNTPSHAELEATAIYDPRGTPNGSLSSTWARRFVLDTASGLNSETRSLLQTRLLVALGILFFGFTLFFVRGIFLEYGWLVRTTQFSLLVLLAAGIAALSRHIWMLETLRAIEVTEFTSVLICLVVTQVSVLTRFAQIDNSPYLVASVKATILYVLLVTSIYCMFIPNRWQRAARMVAMYAISPPLIVFIARFMTQDVASIVQRVASPEQITENVLILVVGSVCAVFGTHVINRLRTQVHEARQVGQYKLGDFIGSGGMGQVFRAEHKFLKRPCAVKLIAPDRKFDRSAIAGFEREVQATAQLTHWNTVDVYDYGRTDEGLFFCVMELLEGLSLQKLIDDHGPMAPQRLLFLTIQICDALGEAESAKLIHRDIKPSNIFVAIKGGKHDVAKLLDFGLVQSLAPNTSDPSTTDEHISGSPLYLSPEQANRQQADGRSDIYSLGAVMYFALSGRPPFVFDDPLRVILAHATDTPANIHQFARNVPDDLSTVVHRCLQKDPALRYATASELATDLSDCECASQWSFDHARQWWDNSDTC